MSATTMLKTALTLLVLMLSPELHAEDSDDALVLRTLEAQLAFDLPPSELRDFPWGQVLEAEMWHAHARNNPGATSGRCHAAKPLRRASSLSIAGPSAMATVDCGDGLNIGVPIIDELPSHLRILSKGHLQFKLKDFGAQCFRVKRAAIRPGPTEVLVRGAASVWFEGDDSNTQNTQHWSALPWPDGAADARLCALPTSLELDLFFAMRKVTVDAPISLKPGARLLRAFLQADRDKAQKILEEVEADSVDDTFSWVRRAVGQKWPALIHIHSSTALPSLAVSDLSRRIASHLIIRSRIDKGKFAQALRMIQARMTQLGNAGHYLKARTLEGLGWEFEARESTVDALTGLHGDCRVRGLAKSLNVELPPLIGRCPKDEHDALSDVNQVVKALATTEHNPNFRAFLEEPFSAPTEASFETHPTLIVGHRYWVQFESNGDSLVYRKSVYRVHTPRGAVSIQHWADDTDWRLTQLVRRRENKAPEYGHSVQGSSALILEDVQPGDEVEVLQVRHHLADPYLGPGANYERLSCSDRVYPVASCSVHVQQDASAAFPLRVKAKHLNCRRSDSGHFCTGGPYEPAPNEAEPGSPWALLAHVEISHDISADIRLTRVRDLVKGALLSARNLDFHGQVESPEALHAKIRKASPRSASAPESALALSPNDVDLLKGLDGMGEEAFLAHTPNLFAHDSILGQGTRRVVVARGPDQGSIWWTTAFALPFATLLPALDQGRRSLNFGPHTGAQRLKMPVVESTGGGVSIAGDLLYNENNRSVKGSVSIKWTGIFALSVGRSQLGVKAVTDQWVGMLLPGLETPGDVEVTLGEDESSLTATLSVQGSDLRPEDLAIQVAHPQALASLLHRDQRTSHLVLGYGMQLNARLTVDRIEGRDLEPRSEINVDGGHASLRCVRRYIGQRKVDLRCGLKVPATRLSPEHWPNLRGSLSEISNLQRVPLID